MLSLILPTFNESDNLPVLLPTIMEALKAIPHEIIIVDDDSPDRTWEVAEQLQKHFPRLCVIRRMEKRGLSSAVIEGFHAAHGSVLIVMDSDGQHDPALLRRLYKAVQDGSGVAVGSRYVEGGSVGSWVADRRIISRMGTRLAQGVCRAKVSDPLGGFFAIDTHLYRRIQSSLRPTGFKILLEILAVLPAGTRVAEIPLIFHMRLKGRSKLSWKVELQFFWQIVRLGMRRFLPYVFLVAMIVPMLLHFPHLWQIRLLYMSPEVRSHTESALRWAQENEGWVLSNYRIVAVSPDGMVLRHRASLRSCSVTFADPPLATCSES